MSQVAAIKSAFLEALGIASISDADSTQQTEMLRAANAAVQEIAVHSPANWNQIDEAGAMVRGPQSISIQVTNASKAFTWSGLAANAWAYENAIIINGDEQTINRIKKGSTNALLFPYMGSTGTKPASLYNDIVELPDDFIRFKSDFTMLDVGQIPIVGSNRDMQYYGDMTQGSPQFVGAPTAGRIISRATSTGARKTLIKLDALPDTPRRFFFEYYKGPAKITSLEETSRFDLVPFDYTASVLVPWAIWKLSQSLGGITIPADRIAAAYADARNTLDSIGDPTGATPPTEIVSENW